MAHNIHLPLLLLACFAWNAQQITSIMVHPDPNPIDIDPPGPVGPVDPIGPVTRRPIGPIDLPRVPPFDICDFFRPCNCPHGQTYYTTTAGCRRCRCLPKPDCPEVMCALYCPNGFIKNSNGCDTCRCVPTICPAIACDLSKCPNGFEFDKRGCNTCQCKPDPCPSVLCPLRHKCPFGKATDANGCPTCECNGTPTPTCPPMTCPGSRCIFGLEFDTDSNGCLVNCRCKTASPIVRSVECSKKRCFRYCLARSRYDVEIERCACECGMAYIPRPPELPRY